MPAVIADIAYQNKAVIYDLLFKVSAETMRPCWRSPPIGSISVIRAAKQIAENAALVVPGGRLFVGTFSFAAVYMLNQIDASVSVFSAKLRKNFAGDILDVHT